ncbi:hypothetical protein LHK12_21915 [Providencia rettgeri]|nr:hypothetical protein [Providencia rettgeri]
MPYQYNDPYCADCSKRKAWIECVLVDEQNQPLAGLSYTLKVRNGVIRKGVTDAQGYLRQEDLPRTVATLTIESQKLTDEMEKRPLRTLRGRLTRPSNRMHYYKAIPIGMRLSGIMR